MYDKEKLLDVTKKFKDKSIVVVGDIMVDRYIYGNVTRISPEAPVPVVDVYKDVYLPGGAANVANNLADIGVNCFLVGVVGEDARGERLKETLKKRNIDINGIYIDKSRQTTLKTRVIAHSQQVVRIDEESRADIRDELMEKIIKFTNKIATDIDAIIISDYGKGVVSKRLISELVKVANDNDLVIVVDPKVEHFLYYKGVTSITPNLHEAISGMRYHNVKTSKELDKLGFEILRKLNCDCVLITLGEKGMRLFEKRRITQIETKAKEVYDVTGAGDTVISLFTTGIICGLSFVESAHLANFAAGVVVGKLGTATVSINELEQAITRD